MQWIVQCASAFTGFLIISWQSGALKIIDRKKHIFKLAQGEYIAPEKIEQILVQSPPVAQVKSLFFYQSLWLSQFF